MPARKLARWIEWGSLVGGIRVWTSLDLRIRARSYMLPSSGCDHDGERGTLKRIRMLVRDESFEELRVAEVVPPLSSAATALLVLAATSARARVVAADVGFVSGRTVCRVVARVRFGVVGEAFEFGQ